MQCQHVNVKVFVEGDTPDPEKFIDVFHQWIREDLLDELLIDVADYRHVPAGPGVMLIALEADYNFDNRANRWGLRYNRKAPLEGSDQDRLREAFRSAARACLELEKSLVEEGLRFSRSQFEVFMNDRALVPNSAETAAAFSPVLKELVNEYLGVSTYEWHAREDARELFGGVLTTGTPVDLESLAGLS